MALQWDEVRKIIGKDDRAKHDLLVKPWDIKWEIDRDTLYLQSNDSGTFWLSAHAESQLCNWLGIPVRYFRECDPELKMLQVQHRLSRRMKKDSLWRLRLKGRMVRGILSEHYQPFDNSKIASVWEAAGEPGLFEYQLMLDDSFFFMRALLVEDHTDTSKLGGLIKGFYVRNSEVGTSALAAGASIYRLVCSNGLVEGVYRKNPLHQHHIWINEEAFTAKFRTAVYNSLEIAEWTGRRMADASRLPASLDDLVQSLERLDLEEPLKDTAVDLFLAEHDYTMLGVVNALTATARDIPPRKRFDLEAAAGRVLASIAQNN
jgi:hypothetical protein